MKQLYTILLLFIFAFGFSQNAKTNNDIEGFKLYPNPVTSGKVYIKTKANAPKKIVVYDVFGTQVLATTIIGHELNVGNLVSGIYVLRTYEKDKVATRKLIVK